MTEVAESFTGKNMDRRTFVTGSLSAAVLAFLSGCGRAASIVDTGSEEAEPVALTIGITNPSGIEPATVLDSQGVQVSYQLFDTLTSYDYTTNALSCLAAMSYEPNTDATQFSFKIKSATFHNGETVTARSFKRAWERLVNLSLEADGSQNGAWAYLLSPVKGYDEMVNGEADELAGLSCPDDETLVVNLSLSYADFPLLCAHPALAPVPQKAFDDADTFGRAPVGNGAFKIKGRWNENQNITLERYDDYYGGAAAIDSLIFAVQEDADAAYKAFRAEELDICEVPADQLSSAKNDCGLSEDGFTVAEYQRLVISNERSVAYLACNTADEELSSLDLRWGLSLAIDRASICDELYRGARIPATDIVPLGVPGHREEAWACCDYSKADAANRLDKVAPLTKKERAISLTLLYRSVGGTKALVEELKTQLEATGITLETEEASRDDFDARVRKGDYQLALTTWTASIPSMDAVLYPLFHSASVGGRNLSRFADAENVDAKIAAARKATDSASRELLLQEADDVIAVQCPVIPLFYYTHATAASKRVESLVVSPDRRNGYARCIAE